MLKQGEASMHLWDRLQGRFPLALIPAGVIGIVLLNVQDDLAEATRPQEIAGLFWGWRGVAILISLVVLGVVLAAGPGSSVWRWKEYAKGSRWTLLRRPEVIRESRHNQRCQLVHLERAGGTISCCVNVAPAGEGIRRQPSQYVFAYSGGYGVQYDGGSAVVREGRVQTYCVNQFALARVLPAGKTEHWCLMVGSRHFNRERPEVWVTRVDDLPPGWHHFACTWQRPVRNGAEGCACLYIDGQEADSKPLAWRDDFGFPDVCGEVGLVIGTWTNLHKDHYADCELAWVAYYPKCFDELGVKRLFGLQPYAGK